MLLHGKHSCQRSSRVSREETECRLLDSTLLLSSAGRRRTQAVLPEGHLRKVGCFFLKNRVNVNLGTDIHIAESFFPDRQSDRLQKPGNSEPEAKQRTESELTFELVLDTFT